MRGRTLAAIATALTLTFGGCGGDDVQDGFIRHEADGFSIAYPETWSEDETETIEQFAAASPPGDDEATGARLAVAPGADPGAPFAAMLEEAKTRARLELPEGVVRGERELDIEGAKEAAVLDVSFTGRVKATGESIDGRAAIMVVAGAGDQRYTVTVSSAGNPPTDPGFDAIVESFAIAD